MKGKSGKKLKPQFYSHIASAIIPVPSIVAVPSAAQHFPQQKVRGREEWGPLASTLLRASSAGQLLIPSTQTSISVRDEVDDDDDDTEQLQSKKQTSFGRMAASSDEDDSDDDGQRSQKKSTLKSTASRTVSISEAEKRIFGKIVSDEESTTTTQDPGLSSTIHLDPKQALTAELTRSTASTTTTTDDKNLKRATVTVVRNHVPPLILNPAPSQAGPTSARQNSQLDTIGGEIKTARSSLNDTTAPMSARSVSFNEKIEYDIYDPPSSKSQQSTVISIANQDSVLERLVIPPPEEYQHNYQDLEKRNQLLNEEIQQLRSHNQNLQKQHDQLLTRLQTSQKLSQKELNDLLRQTGLNQTKDLDNLNKTLQNRCDQLQNELITLRERYAQEQGQSSARDIKNENHFLKDYIHRLNATISEYQAKYPSAKTQQQLQGLPMKGPSPIWLLDQKFLAPLFIFYDDKLQEREEFIRKLQNDFNEFREQFQKIAHENLLLHERTPHTTSSMNVKPTDVENIVRHAELVVEENKVLQDQLHLQTNRLTNIQKAQLEEVSNLTRRLMLAESEKIDADRCLETIRLRNDELRKKYEQLIFDNDHRIHLEDHVRELTEMKRLTGELSEKHAHEMQLLLQRIKDAESAKKTATTKLSETRDEFERLKVDLKETKKFNKKLQLRVQTFEKKLELEQIREQQLTALVEKSNEQLEQMKINQETSLFATKTRDDELLKMKERMSEDAQKMLELQNRLENLKMKNKENINDVNEQMKTQYENLKIRSSDHEKRIEQLIKLLNEKQNLIDDLNSDKRNLETDLEQIWLTTRADNIRMHEQLHEMRVTS